MEFSPRIEHAILEADSKALATYGKHGINIVPVSTMRIIDHKIYLMNYLFGKTLSNFQDNSKVALVAWSGFEGYQIKGEAKYLTEGTIFEEAKEWIENNTIDRTLVGLLVIYPGEVYNISTSNA